MREISKFQQLKWVQPNVLKMNYELLSGEELVGQLRFRSLLGTLATAESADGCWTFKRVGFMQTRATIRSCGSDAEVARFTNNTWSGGGTLELADGRKFFLTTNFWRTQLEIQEESGVSLVRLKTSGLLQCSASVEMEPIALATPELPWMVMFTRYLIVMMHADMSS